MKKSQLRKIIRGVIKEQKELLLEQTDCVSLGGKAIKFQHCDTGHIVTQCCATLNGVQASQANLQELVLYDTLNPVFNSPGFQLPYGHYKVYQVLNPNNTQGLCTPTPFQGPAIDFTTIPGPCITNVLGCTDPTAINYNSNANVDDGSCIYPPPIDTYDCDQNGHCVVNSLGTGQFNLGPLGTDNQNACLAVCVVGCDPNAPFHSWPSHYPNTAQQSWTWQGPATIMQHPQFTGNQTIIPGDTLDGSWVNWYNATQGTYCEWCNDWDNATAGPFDGRTGVWVGGPYDESMCSCCPGSGQPGPLLSTKPMDDNKIPYEREPESDFLQERFKKLANIKK